MHIYIYMCIYIYIHIYTRGVSAAETRCGFALRSARGGAGNKCLKTALCA